MNYKTTLTLLFLFFISCQVFGQFKLVSESDEFQLNEKGLVFDKIIAPNNTYVIEVDIDLSGGKILGQDFYLHKFDSSYKFEKSVKLELEFDQKDKNDYDILNATYFNNKILIFTEYWIKKEKKSKIEMRVYDAESLELISKEVLLDNNYNHIIVGRARQSEVVFSPDGTKLLVHQYCKQKGKTGLIGYCVLDSDLSKISDGEYLVEKVSVINKKAIVDNNGNSYFMKYHREKGTKNYEFTLLELKREDKKMRKLV